MANTEVVEQQDDEQAAVVQGAYMHRLISLFHVFCWQESGVVTAQCEFCLRRYLKATMSTHLQVNGPHGESINCSSTGPVVSSQMVTCTSNNAHTKLLPGDEYSVVKRSKKCDDRESAYLFPFYNYDRSTWQKYVY